MSRILAVDWGEVRIGLAVSDPTGTIATGLETLVVRTPVESPTRVAAIAEQLGVESIIVGYPLLLSGEPGATADRVERFAEVLRDASELPVMLYDERLTSAISQRRMHERGERVGRRKGRVDQGAAVVLLESWLQKLAEERRRREAGEDA